MDTNKHASPLGEFLTIDDICGLFGLTRATVDGWLDAGELAHYRLGPRTIRIKRSDLEEFLEQRRSGSPSSGNASEVMILRGRRSDHREVAMREGAA